MKGILRIFAYGTLKTGFPGHDRFCRGVLKTEPAHLRGRLFKLTSAIPVLIVPETEILAVGSGNPLDDTASQGYFEVPDKLPRDPQRHPSPGDGWRGVNGEVLSFEDPEARLPLLDSYEEFQFGKESPYIRVLVRVSLADGSDTTAWTYIAGCDTGKLESFDGETWFPDVPEGE